MGGIDFAACRRKIEANSTLIRTVIRGLQKNGYKKTPQEYSYGVWDRKKALILSYQRLFFRRYLILNLTPRSLPPKNIVLPTNSMFSYAEAGKGRPLFLSMGYKKDIFGIIAYEFVLLQFQLEHISLKVLISLFINSILMPFKDGI